MTVEAIAEVLGGKKMTRRSIYKASDLVELTRHGLPADTLSILADGLSIDRKKVAQILGIPVRTLSRRLGSHSRLSPVESDRTVRFARILALASDTFGSMEKASHWLQTPNRVLDGLTPFELLDTDAGVQSVVTVLGRIAYGIYS